MTRPQLGLRSNRSCDHVLIGSLSLQRAVRSGYAEIATPVREGRAEAVKLERRLSDLVYRAYGLTLEEVDLLWSTAPPRMPEF
jgi:hypothetical protein